MFHGHFLRVMAEILLALEPKYKLKYPLRIGNTSEISWNQENKSSASTYRYKPGAIPFNIQTIDIYRLINYEKAENQRRVELQTFHLREINMSKDLIT